MKIQQPIMTDKERTIANKKDLSNKEEMETMKSFTVKYLRWYLHKNGDNNSFADVTGRIRDDLKIAGTNYAFERDIAGRMMRTRNYTMRENLDNPNAKEVYVIAADRDWWDRNKFWFTIIIGGIGIIVGWILNLFSDPIKTRLFPQPLKQDTVQVHILSMPPSQEKAQHPAGARP